MKLRPDQERVRTLLLDTVSLLCKNGLMFSKELKLQGLLGITLDDNEVFVVHFNENLGGESSTAVNKTVKPPKINAARNHTTKRKPSNDDKLSIEVTPTKKIKQRQKARTTSLDSTTTTYSGESITQEAIVGQVVIKTEPVDDHDGNNEESSMCGTNNDDYSLDNVGSTFIPCKMESGATVISQDTKLDVIDTVEKIQGDRLALWQSVVLKEDGEKVPVSVISPTSTDTMSQAAAEHTRAHCEAGTPGFDYWTTGKTPEQPADPAYFSTLFLASRYRPRDAIDKPFQCEAHKCDKSFYHRSHLKRHQQKHHPELVTEPISDAIESSKSPTPKL